MDEVERVIFMEEKQAQTEWTGQRGERGARFLVSPWRRFGEGLIFGGGRSSVLEEISGSLSIDAVVLDVGCGSGYLSLPVAMKLGAGKVLCLDLSDEMLAALRENAAKAGLTGRIQVVKAPASASGLDDASVDLIVSNNVVHELADPREVLAEWIRILKPGGRVVFNDFRSTRLVKLFISGHHQDVHGPYEVEEMESLLWQAGFKEVKVAPSPPYSPGHGRSLAKKVKINSEGA